ncbi:uncharacterized protein LOC128875628 [Hylaeus volcanicus]|uniref:uncharacterized protein LOC128875628 n=1 Tax=Hylaeus volcanicus TaxID=313075 RepID=UPI0023B86D46|nr:uncharacterized protein LOC128875628 [Hylaeus volcanicus]
MDGRVQRTMLSKLSVKPRNTPTAKTVCPSKKISNGKENTFHGTNSTAKDLNKTKILEVKTKNGCQAARGCPSSRRAFATKKTPFHIHRDPDIVSKKNERTHEKIPAPSHISRVRSVDDEAWTSKKPLPSKIPRRVASCSRSSKETKCIDSIKVATKQNGKFVSFESQMRSLSTKAQGIRNGINRNEFKTRMNRCLPSNTRFDNMMTPTDGATLPTSLIPLKAMVRRVNLVASPSSVPVETEQLMSEAMKSLPPELYYNMEYHNETPIVELEREERSPKLSVNFLKRHVNPEQRRLVVAFLINLGTHCRYPSYIIYQAVKIFDAAIDRMSVKTSFIQLTALASLWIALKQHEIFHRLPSASKVLALAKDLYIHREDLLKSYERMILLTLNFGIVFADAYSLLTFCLINFRRYFDVSEGMTKQLYYCGGYAIDVTLLDEEFCRTSAGIVAIAASELVLGLLLDDVAKNPRPRWLFWRGILYAGSPRFIGRFQTDEISRCRVAMAKRIIDSDNKHCVFEVVKKKYSRSKYCSVAQFFIERANRISLMEICHD